MTKQLSECPIFQFPLPLFPPLFSLSFTRWTFQPDSLNSGCDYDQQSVRDSNHDYLKKKTILTFFAVWSLLSCGRWRHQGLWCKARLVGALVTSTIRGFQVWNRVCCKLGTSGKLYCCGILSRQESTFLRQVINVRQGAGTQKKRRKKLFFGSSN